MTSLTSRDGCVFHSESLELFELESDGQDW